MVGGMSDKAPGVAIIGGLIDQGYFDTIVTSGDTFDGSGLRRYRLRDDKCGSFNIFERIGQ